MLPLLDIMITPRILQFLTLRPNFFKILISTGAFLLATTLVTFFLAGGIYEYEDTIQRQNPPGIDAIVCLGGGRGRISTAGDLWAHYSELYQNKHPSIDRVPVLYFSGLGPQTTWTQLTKQLKPSTLATLRPIDVVIENESLNTIANAQWLAHHAREKHWGRILLVTSSYHMKRAQLIFEKTLQEQGHFVEVDTLSVSQEPFTLESWKTDSNGIRVTMLEYLKWLYYRLIWQHLSIFRSFLISPADLQKPSP